MKITYTTISEAGKRYNNEDAFKVMDNQDNGRWIGIVCDGMGGHCMGEVASETVISKITDYWQSNTNIPDSPEKVMEACKIASAAIDERSDRFNHCEMGTTMAMISIEKSKATVAHIGDTRCYVIRKDFRKGSDIHNPENDHIVYETKDHHKEGGVLISRCFFSYKPEVANPEIVQFEVKPGDRILICSDGMYNSIYPHVIVGCMIDDNKPQEQIIDAFAFLCEKNSDDNYTAIMAKIEE